MQSSPFHNGFGMLTVHGVRKPVWQAFSLLANAGDRRLPVTGASVSPNSRASAISVLATLNSSAGSDASAGGLGLGLQLFVANYRRLSAATWFACNRSLGQCAVDPSGSFTDHSACDAQCTKGSGAGSVGERRRTEEGGGPKLPPVTPPIAAANVSIELLHAAAAIVPSLASMRRIDGSHANAFSLWEADMGQPLYPTDAQLRQLHEASELRVEQVAVTRVSATRSAISFAMPGEDATVHLSL